MKKYFQNIVANDTIKNRLLGDIENGKISHAFIFEGDNGSGRHTLAVELAAALSCKDKESCTVPCGKCSACRKIFDGKSPDIINLGLVGDKATIGIETARFIKGDIHIAPNDLPIKMYIIDGADKMTLQAQNALLLSLEEPPPYVIFILICSNSSALLETIKSRAPSYRLERLSRSQISEYLLSNHEKARKIKDESPEDFEELVISSCGTLGRAITLLDDKGRKKEFSERKIAKSFIELSLSRSKSKIFDMISSLGNKRPDISARLTLIEYAIRDLILLKKSDSSELIFYSNPEEASELSAKITLERLIDMYTAIDRAINELKSNANIRLSLLSMMYSCRLAD